MDEGAFALACQRAAALTRGANGIGTLGEKSLHAALKLYFEPDAACHEQKVGGFVADIVGEDGVIEIQTRQCGKLIRKLDAFLEACRVTVVHPLALEKWVIWHTADGGVQSRRCSPKHARLTDCVRELYPIRYALDHPGFRFCVCLLELEEHHLLDGYGKARKGRATRLDRVPLRLLEEVWFTCPSDYLTLLPGGLPECFTVRDVMAAGALDADTARMLLNILCYLELAERVGKQGHAGVFRICMNGTKNALQTAEIVV